VAWLVLTAACSSTPGERPATDFAPFAALATDDFLGASAMLAGFAPPDDDPAMRVGDAALLGIELHRSATVERQLMLLELCDVPYETTQSGERMRVARTAHVEFVLVDGSKLAQDHRVHAVDVALRRYDGAGALLQASVARLYEEPLRVGWWATADTYASVADDMLAFELMRTLQGLADTDPNLQDLLFRVVDKPSVWSVVTRLGVNVSVGWDASKSSRFAPALAEASGPVRCAPIKLFVNGDIASWVDLLVGKPRAATMVCGGLVGAIARHPTEPGRMAVVRLLATRRGPAP